ncbi:helix-turn-helix domain-containing protein [Aquimarina sp. 2201CG5-10]|uniref:helix-turn-helix domain-containing protein n=1 Tax=Aquimarina callyspongiae TaxID=3098150 RepID=UPI002AB581C8|nr:helix-turn-helix domain-containing protein [Aquimarina sp. 2201CG5-10]MDY8135597.1 helix-turn-helix domain-containing protein [Aquimarina sp. 2201CG5-10]
MSVKDALFLISGLQTLIISIVLLWYRSKKIHVNRYLGLFFATLFVEVAMYFLFKVIDHPAIYYAPVRFDFLSVIFLLFYALETTGVSTKAKLKYYIPAGIEFLVFSVIFILVLANKGFHEVLKDYSFLSFFRLVSSIYIVSVCILIISIIMRHQKLLSIHFPDTRYKSLKWLAIFCFICIFLNVVRNLISVYPDTTYLPVIFCATALFSLYYITIGSLIQININNVISARFENNKSKEELEEILKNIETYLVENKLYLNPEMNLKTFSKKINLPERTISRAINRIKKKNFTNYINTYRIEEFKHLLTDKEYKKYSISAIADEVGFNSRASFYKNFKDIVGVSPSDYVKSLNT